MPYLELLTIFSPSCLPSLPLSSTRIEHFSNNEKSKRNTNTKFNLIKKNSKGIKNQMNPLIYSSLSIMSDIEASESSSVLTASLNSPADSFVQVIGLFYYSLSIFQFNPQTLFILLFFLKRRY